MYMLDLINKVEDTIFASAEYSGEKSDSFGEVFTPRNVVIQRVLRCGEEKLCDKSRYWGDLFAGLGQYPIIIVKTLFKTLKSEIPDDYERLKYIVETQLHLGEIQPRSANSLAYYFQFEQGFKVNLYVGSSFDMPEDFFDLTWEERRIKYPNSCALEPVHPDDFIDPVAYLRE